MTNRLVAEATVVKYRLSSKQHPVEARPNRDARTASRYSPNISKHGCYSGLFRNHKARVDKSAELERDRTYRRGIQPNRPRPSSPAKKSSKMRTRRRGHRGSIGGAFGGGGRRRRRRWNRGERESPTRDGSGRRSSWERRRGSRRRLDFASRAEQKKRGRRGRRRLGNGVRWAL